MNIFNRLVNYINGSRHEMKKVVWPTRKEVIHYTIMVMLISIGVSAFLGLVDYLLNIIVSQIIPK